MNRPWLRFYGGVPPTLEYPEIALHEAVMGSVDRVPDAIAFDFFGRTATYRELGEAIDRCAAAFAAQPGMVLDPLVERPDVIGVDLREVADRILEVDTG